MNHAMRDWRGEHYLWRLNIELMPRAVDLVKSSSVMVQYAGMFSSPPRLIAMYRVDGELDYHQDSVSV